MHNLYLLWLAEVGILGFVGVAVLGVGAVPSGDPARPQRDRLLAGIGIGVAGAMGFMMVEELLGYTMRGDVPLALYWLLAGLAAAGTTLAGRSVARARRSARRALPTRPTRSPAAPAEPAAAGRACGPGWARSGTRRAGRARASTLGLLVAPAP